MLKALSGKYKLGIIANQLAGTKRDYIIGEFCIILMLSQLPQKRGMKSG